MKITPTITKSTIGSDTRAILLLFKYPITPATRNPTNATKADNNAYGSCVDTWFTWSDCAPADAIIVVSDIGEQWSPQTAPERHAAIDIISISLVSAVANNGQTIGMKIMRVGLIDNEGVKVTPIQIFIRFLFGKYIICMLIPIYGFIYMGFNVGGGLLGLIVLVSVPIINLIMTYGTQTKSGIANSIAKVYAIDLDDTYIFKNKEERSRALAEQDRLKEEMKKTY